MRRPCGRTPPILAVRRWVTMASSYVDFSTCSPRAELLPKDQWIVTEHTFVVYRQGMERAGDPEIRGGS
jgi:hypothetical protein